MSVLIKGMEIPKCCDECNMEYNRILPSIDYCDVTDKDIENGTTRPSWCPLIEIPLHGRLIDADKLRNDIPETDADCFENCRDCTLLHQEDVWDIIDDATTVIGREKEDE